MEVEEWKQRRTGRLMACRGVYWGCRVCDRLTAASLTRRNFSMPSKYRLNPRLSFTTSTTLSLARSLASPINRRP